MPFMRIPEKCEDDTADTVADLEDVQADLLDLVFLSSFLLSPDGPVAADPAAYFACSSAVWSGEAYCF